MMTSSNVNIFRVTGPLCGEFTGPGEFPSQMPVTRSFDAFFDLRLNKRLNKKSWGWWFETPPWSLWRECNDIWNFRWYLRTTYIKFGFNKIVIEFWGHELDNLIDVIPYIKDKRFSQESDFDKLGRDMVSQLYALGDQLKENKAISVTAIRNRLHDYQSQIENIALCMADNYGADFDNMIQWMDYAAGSPVYSQSSRLGFEISYINFATRYVRFMGDNILTMFKSNRKQRLGASWQLDTEPSVHLCRLLLSHH